MYESYCKYHFGLVFGLLLIPLIVSLRNHKVTITYFYVLPKPLGHDTLKLFWNHYFYVPP